MVVCYHPSIMNVLSFIIFTQRIVSSFHVKDENNLYVKVSFFTINIICIYIKSSSLGKYIIILQQSLLDYVNIAKKWIKLVQYWLSYAYFPYEYIKEKRKNMLSGTERCLYLAFHVNIKIKSIKFTFFISCHGNEMFPLLGNTVQNIQLFQTSKILDWKSCIFYFCINLGILMHFETFGHAPLFL